MRLLPSEQGEAIQDALEKFAETGSLVIHEPCDCGSHIRHNNGGNYHKIIRLCRDSDQEFVKWDTTCELTAPAMWEPCDDVEGVIRQYADWL